MSHRWRDRHHGSRRRGVALATLLALTAALLLLPAPAAAALPATVTFGQPEASATFGESVAFEQPVTIAGPIRRVELLIETPGGGGPSVTEIGLPISGSATFGYSLDASDGFILPNTLVTGRWRVIAADGTATTGPPASVRYEDTRFDWRTAAGELVRVHWYEGSDAFGRRALELAETAMAETEALLGVTESEPIDFFVYATQAAFYDALGPGTRENVGGQANAGIRTLFGLITPAEIDAAWVGVVIPHEIVHLVFDTAVDNPYHYPPRWLNEGLAVYLSEGYQPSSRRDVEAAARNGSLMPLSAIAFQFPTSYERFALAYSQSVSAVDHLVETYGQDALVGLIRSYADGVTDDEAFDAALGIDAAAFDAGWRASLQAAEPVSHGPQPAPAGPLPPGWDGDGSGNPGEPAAPGLTAAPTEAPAAPGPDGGAAGDGPGLLLTALTALLLGIGLVAAIGFVRSRRTDRGSFS